SAAGADLDPAQPGLFRWTVREVSALHAADVLHPGHAGGVRAPAGHRSAGARSTMAIGGPPSMACSRGRDLHGAVGTRLPPRHLRAAPLAPAGVGLDLR